MRGLIPEAWWFGVLAGIAHRFDWSPFWTRVATVLLAFMAPVQVFLIYLAAAWLMPRSWRGY